MDLRKYTFSKLKLLSIISYFLCFFISIPSQAITNSEGAALLPGSVQPGLLEKMYRGNLNPAQRVAPPIHETPRPPSHLLPRAEKIHFKITKAIIQGNTIFKFSQLEKFIEPYINQTISLTQLQNLVEQMTILYRSAGYVLSRAILPPQIIKNGIVRIQIIEGYMSKISIDGNYGATKKLLISYSEPILKEHPLQISTLEHTLLLANDIPGLSVQAVLTPSPGISGSADLALITARKHGTAYVAYDNYGTRYLGPQEVSFGGSLYSIFVPGDNNTAQFTIAKNTRLMQYAQLSHSQPVGANGMSLLLGGNYTVTRPEFILQPLQIVGRSTSYFIDLSYPIVRTRSKNFNIHSMFNYQNVTSTILATPFYQDRIRPLILGGSFSHSDHWHGINTLGLDIGHGFNILGAAFHANQSRPRGQSQYTNSMLNLSRLQFLNARFSLFAAMRSQYSFEPLLAQSQFGFGGPDFGRGYDPSEIVGDNGIAGKLELRMDTTPDLRLLKSVQYYVFYDIGKIWNIDDVNLPGAQSAASTGVGARFLFMPQITGNFFIAKPLTRQVATMQVLGRGSDIRMFFQVMASI